MNPLASFQVITLRKSIFVPPYQLLLATQLADLGHLGYIRNGLDIVVWFPGIWFEELHWFLCGANFVFRIVGGLVCVFRI